MPAESSPAAPTTRVDGSTQIEMANEAQTVESHQTVPSVKDAGSQVDVDPDVKDVAKGAGKVTIRDCLLAVVESVLPAKWKAFDFHYIPDQFGDTVTCPSYGKAICVTKPVLVCVLCGLGVCAPCSLQHMHTHMSEGEKETIANDDEFASKFCLFHESCVRLCHLCELVPG